MMKMTNTISRVTCATITVIMLMQCAGCRSVGHGCYWVVAGVGEWRQDVKNSNQRKKHTNAFGKKMKTEQPMISVYNESDFPIGKTRSIHYKRWISLFSDGSFIALESREARRFLAIERKYLVYISGQWEKEGDTKIILKFQKGTNFGDSFGKDVSIDLSSVVRFPSVNTRFPWSFPQSRETLPIFQENINLIGPGDRL